jgi:hypothetical protein
MGGDSLSDLDYRFTNSQARKLGEEELLLELRECFTQRNRREPSKEEECGLREAAKKISTSELEWRFVERAIEKDTWDPAEGPGPPGGLFSPG